MKNEKEYPKGIYVIGDVHGCYKSLMALIEKLNKDIPIAFVGDLVDRGPQSKEVIEFVKSNNHLCVLGNHDQMMIEDLFSENKFMSNWMHPQNGGKETLENYKSPQDDEILFEHHKWLKELPYYIEFPNLKVTNDKERHLVISHSTILGCYNERDKIHSRQQILWNRNISYGTLPSKEPIFNIFGHTAVKEPAIGRSFADIDTGCVYGNKLTAIHFPSLEIISETKKD